jgi:Sulfotransferase family/Prokaryotic RING finger family 4
MSQICPLCLNFEGRVELAACKHLICSDCFYEYQGKSSSVCPVCTIEIASEILSKGSCRNTADLSESSISISSCHDNDKECVIVHGYRNTSESWHLTLNKRLSDMRLRYEIYIESFTNLQSIFIHVPKTAGTSIEDALFDIRNRSQHAPVSYWRSRFQKDTWQKMFKFAIVRHPFHRLISGYTYWKNGALAGQKVDQPFVHICRTKLDTLPKFVEYLIEVNENNLWDCRDVQGFDGTCPVQFRPQLWFLTDSHEESPNADETNHPTENHDVDCSAYPESGNAIRSKSSSASNNKFKMSERNDLLRYPNQISLDYIGRYEDLQNVYNMITSSIDSRNIVEETEVVNVLDGIIRHIDGTSNATSTAAGTTLKEWPSLPHKRASLHSRELPECFLDPEFMKSVLKVYQCDFDAFGYSI